MNTRALIGLGLLAAGTGAMAALQGRDFDGNLNNAEAYYDTALNITWLADANAMRTRGLDADGLVAFSAAQAWVNDLVLGAARDWRLPKASSLNGRPWNISAFSFDGVGTDVGYNIAHTGNELGHLFYVTLGNQAALDTSGASTGCFVPNVSHCLTQTGPFANMLAEGYWIQQPSWFFLALDMQRGRQTPYGNTIGIEFGAWAVHDGDVGVPTIAVPEPGTWALMLGGLAAVGLVARRRR